MTAADIILAALFIALYLVLRFVTRPQFRWTFVSATMVATTGLCRAYSAAARIVLILSVEPRSAGRRRIFPGICSAGSALARSISSAWCRATREPPAFLMKPGVADAICLIVIVIGLALAWG